ncbi:hypothetical protein ACLOJK_001086 [Asimina triloba]
MNVLFRTGVHREVSEVEIPHRSFTGPNIGFEGTTIGGLQNKNKKPWRKFFILYKGAWGWLRGLGGMSAAVENQGLDYTSTSWVPHGFLSPKRDAFRIEVVLISILEKA